MKTKRVATLNAGKLKIVFLSLKNWKRMLFIGSLFVGVSCSDSDDLNTVDNEPPIDNELPADDEPIVEKPSDEESAIIYTDIEPDFNGQNLNDAYELDLNNDKITDFTVSLESDNDWQYIIITSKANNGIFSVAPWYTHPVPLNAGDRIFSSGFTNGGFYESAAIFMIGYCFGGDTDCYYQWKAKEDKYLGLQFGINGRLHYGWARINMLSNSQWIIKDYAYNATPGKYILAGQKE